MDNPNDPVFTVTREQWDRARDAAGRLWPTLKEYWPQITLTIVFISSLVGGGTYVATTNAVPPPEVKVEPKVTIDFKPVIEELDKLGQKLDSLGKKLDEKPAPVDPKADPLSPIKFAGATKADVNGDPVEVRVMLGKGAEDLKVWPSPNTTSYVKVFGDTVIVRAKDSSDIFIEAVCTVNGKLIDPVYWRIVAGQGPMPPPGPEPEPKPKPPVPTDKGPFDGATGLHVLIVFQDNGEISKEHYSVIYGKTTRDYLNSKCAMVNGTPQRRIYDVNTVMDGESTLWKNAMKRPRTSIPWIAVGNGANWVEQPLPNSVSETLALLKKFGGE